MLAQTVILDCCHSGSGTRQLDHSASYLERGFELEGDYSIPASLDKDLWSDIHNERAAAVAPGYEHSGLTSHVLLTACREGQKAGEDRDGGMFTRALLSALRAVAMDRTTYQDLMRYIPEIPE